LERIAKLQSRRFLLSCLFPPSLPISHTQLVIALESPLAYFILRDWRCSDVWRVWQIEPPQETMTTGKSNIKMKRTLDSAALIERATSDRVALALFSGLIAHADNLAVKQSISALLKRGVEPGKLHEIILQSYLFCGFPRMLEALFNIAEALPGREYLASSASSGVDLADLGYSESEATLFAENGAQLIRRVYGSNFDRLESAIVEMSPEVFRLMVIEGYGKTLSRSGLDSICRELATVAALTVDGRSRQLKAHLRGSLNVGASRAEIDEVLSLVAEFAREDHVEMAETMFGEMA
jgi:4-carboxymuconolactone decarboxylase